MRGTMANTYTNSKSEYDRQWPMHTTHEMRDTMTMTLHTRAKLSYNSENDDDDE
jgi:hypothetical protein